MSDAETARRSMLETSAFLGTQQYEEPTEVRHIVDGIGGGSGND